MLPIATLPVAAILLRLGQPDMLDIAFMAKAGGSIFDQLPLLFAIGIAIGLSKDGSGAAALAGAAGYFVLTAAASTINDTINMSFFGGIVAGVTAGHTYNRFHSQRLPEYLAFFAGKRLVPIMTGLITLVLAWIAGHVWPAIQLGIDTFGHQIANSGAIGQFIYGTLNRALIPIGLHHVLNSIFWFGLGDFTNAAGELVKGDLPRFFAGDPSAGRFMVGFYPVMMFGLPAAALAMYLAAPVSRRPAVGGMLLSLGLTSMLTGVTEPLEFMFVFLAPALYAVHAILTGVAMVVTNSLGVLHGFGFSAGMFDFILNWGLATKPSILLVVGPLFGVIYFCTFYFGIQCFNFSTPGRESESPVHTAASDAIRFTKVLGGPNNINQLTSCITRIRAQVVDPRLIDENVAREAGVKGIITNSNNTVQLVIGKGAPAIVDDMQHLPSNIDWTNIETAQPNTSVPIETQTQSAPPSSSTNQAADYLAALGGHANIKQIGACITRLRLQVYDTQIISDDELKKIGAQGVVRIGDDNIQVIIGPLAEVIAAEMQALET